MFSLFTKHPNEQNENYIQHMVQAWKISAKAFKISVILLIHGLFPFLFVKKGSDEIKELYGHANHRRNDKEWCEV
jgi:hypothetical protein